MLERDSASRPAREARHSEWSWAASIFWRTAAPICPSDFRSFSLWGLAQQLLELLQLGPGDDLQVHRVALSNDHELVALSESEIIANLFGNNSDSAIGPPLIIEKIGLFALLVRLCQKSFRNTRNSTASVNSASPREVSPRLRVFFSLSPL